MAKGPSVSGVTIEGRPLRVLRHRRCTPSAAPWPLHGAAAAQWWIPLSSAVCSLRPLTIPDRGARGLV
eukprot:CAMPEP_0185556326 /NCGR_PEP_ID=MMETSP1381-20130426/46888_1 /TAXON_ID=298111 /ORGANISM="Pavlova sp., Strain CCMP459" /LENGTH=67 /DNA_ID=CAMNT_0028169703 /DNA_START=90 /DNA_END=290 /DNA_ORIENTATION=-